MVSIHVVDKIWQSLEMIGVELCLGYCSHTDIHTNAGDHNNLLQSSIRQSSIPTKIRKEIKLFAGFLLILHA